MPALQRISADLGPVAPLDRFADSLATHQDPRFLAPLAHALTPDAPSGEVTGMATPAAGADLPPVQRFVVPPSGVSIPVQRSVSVTPAPPSRPVTLPPIDPRPIPTLPDVVVAPTPSVPAPSVEMPTLNAAVRTADTPDAAADTSRRTSASTTDLPVVSRTIAPNNPPKAPTDSAPGVPTIGTIADTAPGVPTIGTIADTARGVPTIGTIADTARGVPTIGAVADTAPSVPTIGAVADTAPSPPATGAPDQAPIPTTSTDLPIVSRSIATGPTASSEQTRSASPPVGNAPTQPASPPPPMPVVSRSVQTPASSPSPTPSSAGSSDPSTPSKQESAPAEVTGEAPLVGESSFVAALGDLRSSDAIGQGTDAESLPPVRPLGTAQDAGPSEVVQRTIATSSSASSPSYDQPSVPMQPLPVVSRSVAISPGPSTEPRTRSEAPLIGATDLTGPSSFVAALGQPSDQADTAPADDLPVVSRTVAAPERIALPVAPPQLLWPQHKVVQRSRGLSSERPLTVPYEASPAADAPAVRRISYDNPPVQRSEAQTITHAPAQPRQVVAPVQPTPAVRPETHQVRETVRALPLQRMFGDLTTSGSSEPVQTMTEWQVPAQRDAIPTTPAIPTAQEVPAVTPVVQMAEASSAAPAASTAAPGTPQGTGGVDVDEMAKRLYEPLTARLRAELWLDRERAGLVTDRWR